MQTPFVSRRLYEDVLADRERIRSERNQFAKDRDVHRVAAQTVARQFEEADTANRRLRSRNARLNGLLESMRDKGALGTLRQHHIRLERALRGCARYVAAYWKARAEIAELTRRLNRATEGLIDMRRQLNDVSERVRKAEAVAVMATERPIDGAPARRDTSSAAELRRAKDHARALDQRLAELTAANQRCTCHATQGDQ